jgi:hypothetical protein
MLDQPCSRLSPYGSSYDNPTDVNWGWFDAEIMERKFKGWEGCLPEENKLPSVLKKDYPGVRFMYYRLPDTNERRGGIFVVGGRFQ